jgi:hypothetical protein
MASSDRLPHFASHLRPLLLHTLGHSPINGSSAAFPRTETTSINRPGGSPSAHNPPPPTPAQVYKRLGQSQQAMIHLTRALDLSPKDTQQIKAALLNLERDDNVDEEEEL